MSQIQVKEKFGNRCWFIPCEILQDAPSLIQGIVAKMGLTMPEGKDSYTVLMQYLDGATTKMLFVLDNFETPWWNQNSDQRAIENLVQQISNIHHVSVLLTMRGADAPGDIHWDILGSPEGIPTLSLDAAVEAFCDVSRKIYSLEDIVQHLQPLLQELDCMPLAVTLIAHQAQRVSLPQLMKMWMSRGTAMLKKVGAKDSRLTSIEYSIDLTLKIVLNSPGGTCVELLPVLSYLPNGVPLWSGVLKEIVSNSNDVDMQALSLVNSSLVYLENDGLKMLSPIREYLQHIYPIQPNELDKIEKFYLDYIANLPAHNVKAASLVGLHMANISKILHAKIEQSLGIHHFKALERLSELGIKFYEPTLILIDLALSQQKPTLEIQLRLEKASILRVMGKYKDALDQIQITESIIKTNQFGLLRAKTDNLLAKILKEKGNIYSVQHEYDNAKRLFKAAQSQYEDAGDQLGVASCTKSLGDIHQLQNEYKEAEDMLQAAKLSFENIKDKWGVASCMESLGDIHRIRSEYKMGRELLEAARLQYEILGDELGLARCFWSLADICQVQDQYDEAKQLLHSSTYHYEHIGDSLGVASCMESLGNAFKMQDQYNDATEWLQKGRSQYENIGDQLGIARCIESIGDIHRLKNEYHEAHMLLQTAKDMYETMGNQRGIAGCLWSQGDIHHINDNYTEAEKVFNEAKSLYELISDLHGLASCMASLGDIHLLKNDYLEARMLLLSAVTIFETIGGDATWCQERLEKIEHLVQE
ncbi:TPR-like protein [Gymnopus androsaceus JB14]|uniref:TPR-like protein n=1 Tax=Gymnopus androsaceus JB14 TaxID=1447944 RepID=A0A6A4HGS8_9AGAR|nr:TPR-like protein [Gymnopus androsaceus JB14]